MLHYVEPYSRTLYGQDIARPVIALKDKRLVFQGNPKPPIDHLDLKAVVPGLYPNGDFGVFRGIFYGIVHKIGQGQGQDLLIKLQDNPIEFTWMSYGLSRLQQTGGIKYQLIEIGRAHV